MRLVARIITRMTEEGDGLFLGVTLKGGEKIFKPNTVYDLKEWAGEVVLVEAGEAHVNWHKRIGDIVEEGKHAFLTKEEYKKQIERDRSQE